MKMKNFITLAAVLLSIAALACNCTRDAIKNHDAQGEVVDSVFSKWNSNDTPGAAILVVRNKKILLEKCYGLRDIRSGTEIEPDTVFLLGSITKQFTAMAVMMLAERGQISYEDSIHTYLPGFQDYAKGITIRQLLVHTGGLPEFDALFLAKGLIDSDWPRSLESEPGAFQPTTDDALAVLYRAAEPRFMAGTEWEYSNSGYVVLARIVEVVSRRSLPEFLDENIFKPLGMTSTFMSRVIKPDVENIATSYTYSDNSYSEIDYAPQNAIYGSNNVYSTIRDMYKWDQALYSEKLVKRRTLDEAFSSGKTIDGKEVGYGFGWKIGRRGGYKEISHGGRWLGFRTGVLRIPEKKFTIVILSNSTDSRMSDWMDRLVEIYFQGERGIISRSDLRVPDRRDLDRGRIFGL